MGGKLKKIYLLITLLFFIFGCDGIKKDETKEKNSKFLISKELKEFTIFAIHLEYIT